MPEDLLGRIHFARYQRWIERMPGGCTLKVFDAAGRPVWGGGGAAEEEIARRLLQVPQQEGAAAGRQRLDGGQMLLYRALQVAGAAPAGWVALIAHAEPPDLDRIAEALEDVAAGVAAEAASTQDLDRMAEELGECYEELHLVFAVYANVTAHAWEDQDVLRTLLRSAAEHLRADMAAFVRPADIVRVHAGSPGAENPEIERLLEEVRGDLFSMVRASAESVVINTADDPRWTQIRSRVPCRILACPVQIEHGVDGVIVLLNPMDRRAFTNSDRRLLEVMANQLSSLGKMIASLKKREAIEATFGKYLDPRIVRNLIEDNHFARVGERRPMSVLFADLEGFTGLCERLPPDAAVKFLNGYFNQVSGPIVAKQGIIDKYMGDAVMAFWGPPFTSPADHARLACEAALAQIDCLAAFRRNVRNIIGADPELPRVNMRTGISTGEVTVGNVGSDRLKGYTVIGDTVNLASRLETACKHYGVNIIITEETRTQAGAAIETRELDRIRVIGRVRPVNVFELIGLAGAIPPSLRELRDAFQAALLRYRAGDFAQARTLWRECARIAPEDPATRVFVERCDVLCAQAVHASWDGVWTLSAK